MFGIGNCVRGLGNTMVLMKTKKLKTEKSITLFQSISYFKLGFFPHIFMVS